MPTLHHYSGLIWGFDRYAGGVRWAPCGVQDAAYVNNIGVDATEPVAFVLPAGDGLHVKLPKAVQGG